MADSTATSGTDWTAALDGAAQSMGKPLSFTPTAFANFYGPYADKVAEKTGIDANTILGQWGHETGWGRAVVPGTNNLGNIKDFSGTGVKAVDNQTGTTDAYRKFANMDDFANSYASLLARKYPGALNTGMDARATASALKSGGYAEDPNYVNGVTQATASVAKARGLRPADPQSNASNGPISDAGAADWGSLVGKAAPVLKSGAKAEPNALGFTPMAAFENQYGTNDQTGMNPDPNPLVALGAGVGEGFGKAVLGGQALVGKGVRALGNAVSGGPNISGLVTGQQPSNVLTRAGDWLVNDAQTGAKNLTQQANEAGGDTFSRKAGEFVGTAAPLVVAGPELLPQIAAGATYGGSQAALYDQNIAKGAVEGAGLGAGGYALGRGIGAAAQAAKPAITKALTALRGGEDAAAGKIAGQLGDQLQPTIDALKQNSNEIIPGSLPTAAEAANNPAIVRLQRQMQNTAAGQEAFPARAAANNDARMTAGQAVVGSGIDAEAQQFAQQQAERILRGQAELPPVNAQQAAVMQTPAYARAIADAKTNAASGASDAFTTQQAAVHQGLNDAIERVAGTPETLEAARAARAAQGEADYAGVQGLISADGRAFADLEARPGFNAAMRKASGIEDNANGLNARDPYVYGESQRNLVHGPNGELNWVESPAPRFVDASVLQGARSALSDEMSSLARAGRNNEARSVGQTLEAVDRFLGANNEAFNTARANYAANSVPIDQQAALQQRLTGAVNNLTGEVSAGKLNSTINSIAAEQAKAGARAADRVTPEQLAALQQVGQQAQRAGTNMTGLNGQGQEYLRQALEGRAAKTGAIDAEATGAANQAFREHLAQNSPAYRDYFNVANGYGADLASRQALAEALNKLSLAAHNANGVPQMTFAGAKSALNQAGPLTGAAQEYGQNLLADLQRGTAANAALGAAGSQTAANLNLGGGGLLGNLIQHKVGDTAIGAAVGSGHVLSAAVGAVVQRAMSAANAKTEKAAIELLLNPKKLASALEKFKDEPSAKQAFVNALKQKAAASGKTGVAAVQTYEAAHTQ